MAEAEEEEEGTREGELKEVGDPERVSCGEEEGE